MQERTDVEMRDAVIVGGGLAGLTAAAFLARSGASVTVLEKASEPGGRARTVEREGFRFNLGSHAFYLEGEGAEAYRELEVEVSGSVPDPSSLRAADAAGIYRFPAGPGSLLGNERLGWRGKLEFVALAAKLQLLDPADFVGRPIGDWLEEEIGDPTVRDFLDALVRLSTYCDDPDQDAGAVLGQLQMAVGEGAFYVDDGWGALVGALRDRAEAAGAEVRTGCRAVEVRRADGGWKVRTGAEDAGPLAADAVVLATGSPEAAVEALAEPPASLQAAADAVRPVEVSCLDLGLRRLPREDHRVVLGTDQPIYVSDYASVVDVAPGERALLHTARYGDPEADGEGADGGPPGGVEAIEAFLDRVQPGWRDEVVVRQPLPSITVAWDRPLPGRGGLSGRYGPVVPEAEGLYVAGDWVGPEGMLSDAAVASARRAAETALEAGPVRPTAEKAVRAV